MRRGIFIDDELLYLTEIEMDLYLERSLTTATERAEHAQGYSD